MQEHLMCGLDETGVARGGALRDVGQRSIVLLRQLPCIRRQALKNENLHTLSRCTHEGLAEIQ